MQLYSFSSILQLSATIAIAFVAVEYVKSYIQTISEKLFNFKEYLASKYAECNRNLPDRCTIDSLKPIDVDGNSTAGKIEQLKINYEKVVRNIDEKNKWI